MWDIEKSKELYLLEEWGQGFFSINDKGHICVLPEKNSEGPNIDIYEVIEEIKAEGIQFPVVVRFQDILRSQVINLNKTFAKVMEEAKYNGKYMGVFPIKVNQMREVVEEIIDAGAPYDHGLEAGSKPELMVALVHNTNKNSLTILNGYKDEDYLRLALLGIKLGKKVIVVIEKFSELLQLVELSKEMGVEPLIGFRTKLTTKGSGKWSESTGESAKFGLNSAEIITGIKFLKDQNLLSSLKLFHFHIGSQIPDIRTFKDALNEGARIFAQMVKLGAPLEYFDVGGGLGIDYDGSKSVENSSVNYGLREYVEDVVYIVKQVCDLEEVDHPNIVTESGRALTAHHSCIITNVFGSIKRQNIEFNTSPSTGEYHLVKNMRDALNDLNEDNVQLIFNDSLQYKEEAQNAFKLGVLTLEEKAKIETLFWQINVQIKEYLSKDVDEEFSEEVYAIKDMLSEKYLCNLSIFQSAPDAWAIDQILPVMPITNLNERPTKDCTLADITCDSDGKLDQFIGTERENRSVPLHNLSTDSPYYVGLFMTGAYQDIMGDNHNLFGKVNEVHIFADDDDPTDFYIEEVIKGETSEDVLHSVQYNPLYMTSVIKKTLDTQVKRGKIRPKEGVKLADFYVKCIKDYTYLRNS